MRLIFAGTPPFAAAALAAMAAAGHEVVLVLTQPDRPAGRGMKLVKSETSQVAAQLGLRTEKPPSLKDPATHALLREMAADVMVVAAYGMLLPQVVLDIPTQGCLNIHGSLLPRWRGAAPVQRAIEAGDSETGICIMQMDAGLDTGPVLLERRISISPNLDTSATLLEKLSALGAESIVETLSRLPQLTPQPQPAGGITYARKIEKSEAPINWAEPAHVLERRMRAFDPFPGCEAKWGAETIKIWRAAVVPNMHKAAPGTVIEMTANRLTVQCGQDALTLNVVQKPGGKRLAIADFLHGMAIKGGVPATAIQLGSVFS